LSASAESKAGQSAAGGGRCGAEIVVQKIGGDVEIRPEILREPDHRILPALIREKIGIRPLAAWLIRRRVSDVRRALGVEVNVSRSVRLYGRRRATEIPEIGGARARKARSRGLRRMQKRVGRRSVGILQRTLPAIGK